MFERIEEDLINVEYDLWMFEDNLTKEQKQEIFKIRQKILEIIIAVREWDK